MFLDRLLFNESAASSAAPQASATTSSATPSAQTSTVGSQAQAPVSSAGKDPSSKPRNTFAGRIQAIAEGKATSQSPQEVAPKAEAPKADTQGAAETEGSDPSVQSSEGTPQPEAKKGVQEFDIGGKKIALDLSKPDTIAKKIADLDHGMRKAFAERDAFKKQVAEYEASKPPQEQTERFDMFNKLVDQYTVGIKQGNVHAAVDSFIRNVVGEKELLAWKQRQLERHSYMLTATPEERQRMEAEWSDRDALEADKYQVAIERAEIERTKQQAAQAIEAKELAEVNSMIMPAYQKVLFKDKPKLNAMIWEDARKAMTEHIEAGNELTKEFAAQAFKAARASIEAEFNMTASQEVAKVVAAKKEEAMTSINAAVQAKESSRQPSEDPLELMKQGRLAAAFRARFKQ